jgi:hypothetical protein
MNEQRTSNPSNGLLRILRANAAKGDLLAGETADEIERLRAALEKYADRSKWAEFFSDGGIFKEQPMDPCMAFDSDDGEPWRIAEDALRGADKTAPCTCGHCLDCLRRERGSSDGTAARALATSVSGAPFGAPTAALYPPKHPITERPWGWYREITPGTFTVEKGDWPPPEPDDTVWYPLYSARMSSRESPR